MNHNALRLIGDIGGTNARLALAANHVLIETSITVLKTADYPTLLAAIQHYLQLHAVENITEVRLAIAGPVSSDRIAMTNAAWIFSVQELTHTLRASTTPKLQSLCVINDFEAQALALPHLQPDQFVNIGNVAAVAGCKSVIGPGTGFGAASIVTHEAGTIVLPSEGGHAGIAPNDMRELAIFNWLLQSGLAVTREELLSGPGLEHVYQALASIDRHSVSALRANEIVDAALAGDGLAGETLNAFCALLGSAARDQALICGAHGGVYISGGIVMHFVDRFLRSGFRQRFETSPMMATYLKAIPTYLITTPFTGLIGAANAQ